MEINKEKMRNFIFHLFDKLQGMEEEMYALRSVLLAVRLMDIVPDLDESLGLARAKAHVVTEEKYRDLKKIVQHISDQAESNQESEKWTQLLERLSPEGPIQ